MAYSSAKGATGRRQGRTEHTSPCGGALDTVPVLRVFPNRRDTLMAFMLAPLAVQDPQDDQHLPIPKPPGEDTRLPNGKSQQNEIVKQQHADAMKDADALVAAAEELRDELKRAGNYVVPVGSVRKTEEIEKLAKRIRGRLKN